MWSPRAQADKRRYGRLVYRSPVTREPNIESIHGRRAARILVRARPRGGLALEDGPTLRLRRAGDHDGHVSQRSRARRSRSSGRPGRADEPPSRELAESLKSFGFDVGPFEDRHSPASRSRIRSISIGAVADGRFALEPGDDPPVPFSFLTESIDVAQIAVLSRRTRTIASASIVLANIDKSPLFNGQIQGIGPRYCPSLEDKIVRFPQRERHQIYLEPEGRRRRRDLRQRIFDEPAARTCSSRSCARCRASKTRGCCGPRTPWSTTSSSRPS